MEASVKTYGCAIHPERELSITPRYPFITGFFVLCIFLVFIHPSLTARPTAGFSLPDHIQEVTFKYETFKNLILLPVTINDTIRVNLILDTGCRNLLLFGKRFEKMFTIEPAHKIKFSGLGDGMPLSGKLSLDNKVSIHALLGEKIPVIIVPKNNLFSGRPDVHGIIGYDIFIKFETEFNASKQLITFRPAALADLPAGYTKIPLRIEDCKPLIHSKIFFSSPESTAYDVMLDTGSALGLLLRFADPKKFGSDTPKQILGRGLSGNVMGTVTWAEKLILETYEINALVAGVSWSATHSYGSIGMGVMKDYTIVLNYCKAYAGFKESPKRAKNQLF
jgi:Aspartyl protease